MVGGASRSLSQRERAGGEGPQGARRKTLTLLLSLSGMAVPSDVTNDSEELMAWLSVYQLSRDMMPRGIVEVLWHD